MFINDQQDLWNSGQRYHVVLRRPSCSIKTKCLEVHFGHVQLNYTTEIQTTCNEFSACSGIAAYLIKNSSVCLCLNCLFHVILHGNLPMKLTSAFVHAMSKHHGGQSRYKDGNEHYLLLCNGKPKLQQKLSCSMQCHCLSTIGVWFTVCCEGRKKSYLD